LQCNNEEKGKGKEQREKEIFFKKIRKERAKEMKENPENNIKTGKGWEAVV
jgi:hypothetical protein